MALFELVQAALAEIDRREGYEVRLRAWAADAEDHFNEGNGCYFQIRSFDSASGSAVEVSITAEGYDIEEIAE